MALFWPTATMEDSGGAMKFHIQTWGCQNGAPSAIRRSRGAGAQRSALCDRGVVPFIQQPQDRGLS